MNDLAERLNARGWECKLVGNGDAAVLRLQPPDAGDGPDRAVEVVVQDRAHGPYLYAKTPNHPIADVDDLGRAVSAIELVQGSKPPPPPPVPEGLARAAAEWGGRVGDRWRLALTAAGGDRRTPDPAAACTPRSLSGNPIMTAMPKVADSAEAKAWLRDAHPHWSIVHSDKDRWWGFLDTRLRGKAAVPTCTTEAEADTPQQLHELLVEAES